MDYSVALPSKPRVVTEDETSGLFEIDGLFPGYGHTLGNSLRRIILSSLSGTAITGVKIDGVPHEFSTITGVQEDVITILLNLKRVRFTMVGTDPQVLTLDFKGPGDVTAKDIQVSGQVEVLNPEQHIASVTAKTSLTMELTVEKGLGYVPREMRDAGRAEIGFIALDATFTPIRRVNYEVENMRVGDRTDFNRLRIFIETDGAISPRQALERSVEIMIHQLKAIVGFKETRDEVVDEYVATVGGNDGGVGAGSMERRKEQVDSDILKTRIESLKLSTRTVQALGNANIRTIGGLARKKEEDILAIEGLGIKGLQEIKRALSEFGVTLR